MPINQRRWKYKLLKSSAEIIKFIYLSQYVILLSFLTNTWHPYPQLFDFQSFSRFFPELYPTQLPILSDLTSQHFTSPILCAILIIFHHFFITSLYAFIRTKWINTHNPTLNSILLPLDTCVILFPWTVFTQMLLLSLLFPFFQAIKEFKPLDIRSEDVCYKLD